MRKNTENETNKDYNFARCRYCRFPLDKSRDREVLKENASYTTINTVTKNKTTAGGCPKCGCPQPY